MSFKRYRKQLLVPSKNSYQEKDLSFVDNLYKQVINFYKTYEFSSTNKKL